MRTRLVAPVLVALLPGAVLLAPPAQAAPLGNNRLISAVVFSFDAASGTSCSKTAGDGDTDATTFAADGVARTVTSSGSATYANSDGTDVTTMTGTSTSTITATQTATRLDTVTLTRTFNATLNANRGTAQKCRAMVQDTGIALYYFDLPAAAYATLTVTSAGGNGQLSVQGQNGVTAETTTSGAGSTSVTHALLPAGSSYLSLQEGDLQLTAPTPTSQPGSSASGSVTATLQLQDPGIATSATTGKAKRYVDLAPVRDCAAGTLSADWTRKAGARKRVVVKKAVFYADGVEVGKERRPDRTTTTTLKGLDPTTAVEITAKLTLVKKGHGKLELSRSYLACR